MVRTGLSLISLGLCLGSGYLYYVQNLKWRSCFNELGRCLDATTGVVYHEQSGIGWLILTILTFGAFLFLLWPKVKSSR